MLNKNEKKFLDKIAETPGIAAADLPRQKRGETIKSLELGGLIHFGPGGWYLTDKGEIARLEDVAADVGGIPEVKIDTQVADAINRGEDDYREKVLGQPRINPDPRGKQAEDRSSAERVAVIHARANVCDRVMQFVLAELAPFADDYDRRLILGTIERDVCALKERT